MSVAIALAGALGLVVSLLTFTGTPRDARAADASGAATTEAPVSGDAPTANAETTDPVALQADVERGKRLGYTCLGCHAVRDYKNAYPMYRVPKLQGQHPEYLAVALRAYASGERSHATMHAQAVTLSAQDIVDIAAYFAGEPIEAPATVDASAMEAVPTAVQTCVACHGTSGVGILPEYPTLAGQHPDYLQRSLADYKRGARRNPIMVGFAATLSDADIRAAAEYYAEQKPSLKTRELGVSRFSWSRAASAD